MSKEFDQEQWYFNLVRIASNPNRWGRYYELVRLHEQTLGFYIPAITAINPENAYRPSSDGRTILQVVGHILAWEEWQLQVFTSQDRGQELVRQMNLEGYQDPDTGEVLDFRNPRGVDRFNAYQTAKYAKRIWEDVQDRAIKTALELQRLFPETPPAGWLEFLDSTPLYNWKLTEEHTITVPAGWYLWMVSLEHEAVEHRQDLMS